MLTNQIVMDSLSIADKASTSLVTLLLGMCTVFSVLLVIMLIVMIIGKIFTSKDKKAAKKAVTEKAKEETAVVAPTESEDAQTEDENAIIAAITAAVSICMEQSVGSFRVVSFKKTSTKNAWNKK